MAGRSIPVITNPEVASRRPALAEVFGVVGTLLSTSLLSGAREHVVMRRLGHADIQTTLNLYGWVTEDAELRTLADWRSFSAGWRGWEDAGE
jgi:integrase